MEYESGGFVGRVVKCLIWAGLIKERDWVTYDNKAREYQGHGRSWGCGLGAERRLDVQRAQLVSLGRSQRWGLAGCAEDLA